MDIISVIDYTDMHNIRCLVAMKAWLLSVIAWITLKSKLQLKKLALNNLKCGSILGRPNSVGLCKL